MKVIIVGCGNVGMSYAYTLVNHHSRVDELVLIDINKDKAQGEALDLNHALPFSPSKIRIKAGDYSDCNNADIIVLTAGANQKPGETRLDLINKNKVIFKDIIDNIKQTDFNGIYVVATNPVDIMSYITYKLTGNAKKVIGTGTTLDTARLKFLLGNKLNISPKNIHAYVVGEHGDSEMIPWSKATIGLREISDYVDEPTMEEIHAEVKNSAYDIINKKGNTSYGIGVCLLTITNSITTNDNAILTLSSYDKQHDCYISAPTIMSKRGVKHIIGLELTDKEQQAYDLSLQVIKDVIKTLKF